MRKVNKSNHQLYGGYRGQTCKHLQTLTINLQLTFNMKLRFTLFYIRVSIKQCYAGPEELDNINQIITKIEHQIS